MKFIIKIFVIVVAIIILLIINRLINNGILNYGVVTQPDGGRNVIYISPPTRTLFNISYHAPNQLWALGDKDGIDYRVANIVNDQYRIFINDGLRNEDWFGFGLDVYAPISGVVRKVKNPSGVNPIGKMNVATVGFIEIESNDGSFLVLAHLDGIVASAGQTVRVGDRIGKLSNNGYSRNPHIHIGAYRDGRSLLIEFDRNGLDDLYKNYIK